MPFEENKMNGFKIIFKLIVNTSVNFKEVK